MTKCFICEKKFKDDDIVSEFFGGYAHFDCLDKRLKENKKRKEEKDND